MQTLSLCAISFNSLTAAVKFLTAALSSQGVQRVGICCRAPGILVHCSLRKSYSSSAEGPAVAVVSALQVLLGPVSLPAHSSLFTILTAHSTDRSQYLPLAILSAQPGEEMN